MKTLRLLVISMRPNQWIKNTFVFMPVLFAKLVFDGQAWAAAFVTFVAFCAASSGVYLWNDVADRLQDKIHPLKRRRPIASGALEASTALTWAWLLMLAGLGIAYAFRIEVGVIILLYVGVNLLYTRWLREVVILDVFCIAFFFVLRVIAGLVATDVVFSYWMMILAALLALFLALNKRRYELVRLSRRAVAHRGVLRKYSPYFIDQMCAAITAAVMVVYIIFTLDPQKVQDFGSHNLVFSIPFVCYGIFRYQYLVFRRGLGGDPARIILSDGVLLVNLVLWALVCGLAVYAPGEWVQLPLE